MTLYHYIESVSEQLGLITKVNTDFLLSDRLWWEVQGDDLAVRIYDDKFIAKTAAQVHQCLRLALKRLDYFVEILDPVKRAQALLFSIGFCEHALKGFPRAPILWATPDNHISLALETNILHVRVDGLPYGSWDHYIEHRFDRARARLQKVFKTWVLEEFDVGADENFFGFQNGLLTIKSAPKI